MSRKQILHKMLEPKVTMINDILITEVIPGVLDYFVITQPQAVGCLSNQSWYVPTDYLTTQNSSIDYFIWFTRSYDGFIHGLINSHGH